MNKLNCKFFGAIIGGILALTVPAQAQEMYPGDSYYGGWELSNRRQGDMVLGDGSGTGLDLGTTERYCGRPGSKYSVVRKYIASNYPNSVSWFVDDVCNDGYVRICVYSERGNMACSSFVNQGWVSFH